ncbi:TetR/AcrR family transcriptional regulator [Pseudomonadales bacterium]|nr:TetR/AcrR family transcriptional regulator [Pseudomonadales bacterium]
MSIYSVSLNTLEWYLLRIPTINKQPVVNAEMANVKNSNNTQRAVQMAPDERRQQLLGIAIHVFATKGIDGARHGDVARAAGVSIPTVHAYFKTRNDLVSAVLDAVKRYIIEDTITPFTSGPTFDERMLRSGRHLMDTVPANSDYFKIWVMWNAYFADPFREQYLRFEEAAVDGLCQVLTGNLDAVQDAKMREKALVFLGLAIFLTQMILRGESIERQEHFVENVVQTVRIWI